MIYELKEIIEPLFFASNNEFLPLPIGFDSAHQPIHTYLQID